MDKRYTNPRLREKFNRAILEEIQDMEAKVVIEHLDSRSERGLQVADAIDYALWAQYEQKRNELHSTIEDKIVSVEEIKKTDSP